MVVFGPSFGAKFGFRRGNWPFPPEIAPKEASGPERTGSGQPAAPTSRQARRSGQPLRPAAHASRRDGRPRCPPGPATRSGHPVRPPGPATLPGHAGRCVCPRLQRWPWLP